MSPSVLFDPAQALLEVGDLSKQQLVVLARELQRGEARTHAEAQEKPYGAEDKYDERKQAEQLHQPPPVGFELNDCGPTHARLAY